MSARKDPVAQIITRLATVVALVVAISLPLGYMMVALENASQSLEFKARVKASALNGLIASTPDIWMFAENRIQGLISREPVPLETELVQVFDAQGRLILQSGKEPTAPVLARSYPLFDTDRVVGRIEVSASQLDRVYRSLVALLLGLLLGAMVFLVMRVLPLKALRRVTDSLFDEKERAETTLHSISDAVITIDAQGCFIQVNPAGLAMLEAEVLEQVAGHPVLELIVPEYRAAYAKLQKRVLAGESMQMQFELLGLKGGHRWLESHSVPMQRHGETLHLAVFRDITERKEAEDKIEELAFYDQLTGLPNRILLLDRLQQAMTASFRSGSYGALLFIDLDHFKTLNDTLGHDMGDLLLQQVAQRLTTCVRAEDTVARLGGDEFVVMLASLSMNETHAANQTEGVGEKILSVLNQTYQLKEVAYQNTPSIGATLFKGHQTEIDDLLKQADLAMYRAKGAGRNALRFFDPDMELEVMQRAILEKDLRTAIQERQFLLYYQAQMANGKLSGSEVLLRWQHPQRGMLPPSEFISLAEETGLILPLGHWVLEAACIQLALWAARPELAHLTVAVNVSAHQFRQPDFVNQVIAVLEHTGANPRRLKLELTESLLVSNVEEIIGKMFVLKAEGVGFSLDDFGTGYSSLSYLKRLPLDQLKIDKSFVRDVFSDINDGAIVQAIIALSQTLGLSVIAEGVETEEQCDFLARLGCLAYQGYLFNRPLPVVGFEEFALRV
ncbi:MAG: EAL domain-containing protein [Sterolibacterium sp.]